MAVNSQPRYSEVLKEVSAAYFREAQEAYAAAARTGPVQEFFYELAGLRVRVLFAGTALISRFTRAWAHGLVPPNATVDLTIHCWDDATTGGHMRRPTEWLTRFTKNNLLSLVSDERYRAYHHDWMHVLSGVDLVGREAFYCTLDATQLPVCESVVPLKHLFNVVLNGYGRQFLHAAAVGTPAGSIILAAPGGSGKSTTALLCLRQGWSYQSDDLCVISGDRPPQSYSVYNTAKIRQASRSRLPWLESRLTHFEEFDEKKSYFYVHEHFPDQMLRQAPVRALVFPQITGEARSRLERARPLEAMRLVIPWTLRVVPTTDQVGERILLALLGRLPSYHLYLGADEEAIPDLLRPLMEHPEGA
jgi:hypothetical protein